MRKRVSQRLAGGSYFPGGVEVRGRLSNHNTSTNAQINGREESVCGNDMSFSMEYRGAGPVLEQVDTDYSDI